MMLNKERRLQQKRNNRTSRSSIAIHVMNIVNGM